jgi:hypothetical protein
MPHRQGIENVSMNLPAWHEASHEFLEAIARELLFSPAAPPPPWAPVGRG